MNSETPTVVEGEIVDVGELVGGRSVGSRRTSVGGAELPPTADCRPLTPITARVPIVVRWATLDDVAFIDSLQKKTNREVGFLPTKAIEGKITLRQCAVAEIVASGQSSVAGLNSEKDRTDTGSALATGDRQLATPVGYIIAADRYSKRDEVGCIVQINVHPDYRRSLVAAQLLQFQYDNSAYGCKLYSCWCAQDLEANRFWEAMGYVPIAFRTGARKKVKKADGTRGARIHIFWQRRIRAGDKTPYWYPSQTGAGEMNEDRLVFPIMPGTSWRDVMPVVLPEDCTVDRLKPIEDKTGGQLEGGGPPPPDDAENKARRARTPALQSPNTSSPKMEPRIGAGFWFQRERDEFVAKNKPVKSPKTSRAKAEPGGAKKEKAEKKSVAIDPRLLQAARELRDRWQEQAHLLDESHKLAQSNMKYDVVRVESNSTMIEGQKELLKLVA